MSGMWKRSHGCASELPPDKRGGNRYAQPTATAPHLDFTLWRARRLPHLSSRLRSSGGTGQPRSPRLRVAIVDGFSIADVLVLVFDIVAGRQELKQIAAGDLLPGNAGGSHEGLVGPRRSLPPRPA